MYPWVTLVVIILVISWSVWLRVCCSRIGIDNIPQLEPRPSPFSNAVQELVATAGGVYLSLVMIVSFLKLELPERVTISALAFDPLAMTAIGVAVIQPLLGKLFSNK